MRQALVASPMTSVSSQDTSARLAHIKRAKPLKPRQNPVKTGCVSPVTADAKNSSPRTCAIPAIQSKQPKIFHTTHRMMAPFQDVREARFEAINKPVPESFRPFLIIREYFRAGRFRRPEPPKSNHSTRRMFRGAPGRWTRDHRPCGQAFAPKDQPARKPGRPRRGVGALGPPGAARSKSPTGSKA